MIKSSPHISVVMPLYNKRSYVVRAIKSIQEQTYSNWELIIVDDGSTDGSSDVIPADDKRIKVFRQENAGPAAARNRGIREAQGELVSFLDADDYYHPSKMEEEVSLLIEKKVSDWMLSAFHVNKTGQVVARRIRDIQGKEFPPRMAILTHGLDEFSVAGTHIDGLCIRRSLLNELNGFDETMRCFEISEFITRCALKRPRVLIYPEPLFCIVKTPDSAFTVLPDKIDGLKKIGESLFSLRRDHPKYSDYLTAQAKQAFINYVRFQISQKEFLKAKVFLTDQYPLPRDRQWYKLWVYSLLPSWLHSLKERMHRQ